MEEAREVYLSRCASCHGRTGAGDGKGAEGMTPAPRDYRDPAWHAATSDDEIDRVTVLGGVARGKNKNMPAHPDLAQRPELLRALTAVVRGFSRETPGP
jgi:mono/diheme cytochrome c family protein